MKKKSFVGAMMAELYGPGRDLMELLPDVQQSRLLNSIVNGVSGEDLLSYIIRRDGFRGTAEIVVTEPTITHNRILYWRTHKMEEIGEDLFREIAVKAVFGV